MFLTIISVLALIFTVLRTWPQFIRIVTNEQRGGVSIGTWMLALANHTGWLVYGILEPIPLFIVSNLLAGVGCAATVYVLRSWRPIAAIVAGVAVVSALVFAIGSPVLLLVVSATAVGMFLPQLIRVFRTNPEGVSPAAWAMAAIASATWIGYGIASGRPLVVAAHYLMFPASLVIFGRTVLLSRQHGHNAGDDGAAVIA